MTLKHIKFSESAVMRELERQAFKNGKAVEDMYIPILSKKASINKLASSGDVFVDTMILAEAMREKGYDKRAENLENVAIIFKQAYSAAMRPIPMVEEMENKYDLKIGDGLLNNSFDTKDFEEFASKEGEGDIENIEDAHKKIVNVLNKSPSGNDKKAFVRMAIDIVMDGFKKKAQQEPKIENVDNIKFTNNVKQLAQIYNLINSDLIKLAKVSFDGKPMFSIGAGEVNLNFETKNPGILARQERLNLLYKNWEISKSSISQILAQMESRDKINIPFSAIKSTCDSLKIQDVYNNFYTAKEAYNKWLDSNYATALKAIDVIKYVGVLPALADKFTKWFGSDDQGTITKIVNSYVNSFKLLQSTTYALRDALESNSPQKNINSVNAEIIDSLIKTKENMGISPDKFSGNFVIDNNGKTDLAQAKLFEAMYSQINSVKDDDLVYLFAGVDKHSLNINKAKFSELIKTDEQNNSINIFNNHDKVIAIYSKYQKISANVNAILRGAPNDVALKTLLENLNKDKQFYEAASSIKNGTADDIISKNEILKQNGVNNAAQLNSLLSILSGQLDSVNKFLLNKYNIQTEANTNIDIKKEAVGDYLAGVSGIKQPAMSGENQSIQSQQKKDKPIDSEKSNAISIMQKTQSELGILIGQMLANNSNEDLNKIKNKLIGISNTAKNAYKGADGDGIWGNNTSKSLTQFKELCQSLNVDGVIYSDKPVVQDGDSKIIERANENVRTLLKIGYKLAPERYENIIGQAYRTDIVDRLPMAQNTDLTEVKNGIPLKIQNLANLYSLYNALKKFVPGEMGQENITQQKTTNPDRGTSALRER